MITLEVDFPYIFWIWCSPLNEMYGQAWKDSDHDDNVDDDINHIQQEFLSAISISTPMPSPIIDWVNPRMLQSDHHTLQNFLKDLFLDTFVTVELCQQHCQSQNFNFVGVEAVIDRFCGNTIATNPISGTIYNLHCPVNPSEMCAAASILSVYQQYIH